MLVRHHFATTHAGVGANDDFGLSVINAAGQCVTGKTTKHHRVNSANARTSQHGKCRFSHHGHVNQHPITLNHTLRLQDGRHPLHFQVQLFVRVGFLCVGFGRHKHQCILITSGGQMAIHSVVAQIGETAFEPLGKGRIAVITNLIKWLVPIDQGGLLGPECVPVFNGTAMEFSVAELAHTCLLGSRKAHLPTELVQQAAQTEFIIMRIRLAIP